MFLMKLLCYSEFKNKDMKTWFCIDKLKGMLDVSNVIYNSSTEPVHYVGPSQAAIPFKPYFYQVEG